MSASNKESPLIQESRWEYYRRMVKGWRSSSPDEAVAIAELSRVVELHQRVAAAIETAVEHSDPDGQQALRKLGSEQKRLAQAVGELVSELGGSPPRPDEGSWEPSELPRDAGAMSYAQDQAELMAFVREDLDVVVAAHQGLATCSEIPSAMHERLQTLAVSAPGSRD